jgi:hypothetical protein
MGSPEMQLPQSVRLDQQLVRSDGRGCIDVFVHESDGLVPKYVASKRGLLTHATRGRARHLVYGPLAWDARLSDDSLEGATGAHIVIGNHQYWSSRSPDATIETAVYDEDTHTRISAVGAALLLVACEESSVDMLDGMWPSVQRVRVPLDEDTQRDLRKGKVTQLVFEGEHGLAVVHYSTEKSQYARAGHVSYAASAVPDERAVVTYASSMLGSGVLNMLPSVPDPVIASTCEPYSMGRQEDACAVLASAALALRQDVHNF